MTEHKKFSFIAHPLDMSMYREYIRYLKPDKVFRDELLLKLFEWTPSYCVREWENISFDQSELLDGIMIMVPFLPEMREIKLKQVFTKIEDAIAIASQQGCHTAALGAFTSILMQGYEEDLSKKYNIKITSGNTLTTALIIQSIAELSARFNRPLDKMDMAIIGASGDIGSACVNFFGNKVKSLNLTARGLSKLSEILNANKKSIHCPVSITSDNEMAVAKSDIVIFVTSSYTTLFSLNDFKPGTIICDASAPLNVKTENKKRKDVFLYHGGVARIPFTIDPGFNIGLASKHNLYGCLLEGMLINILPEINVSWGRGNIRTENIHKYLELLNSKFPVDVSYTLENHLYTKEDLKNYTEWFNMQSLSIYG